MTTDILLIKSSAVFLAYYWRNKQYFFVKNNRRGSNFGGFHFLKVSQKNSKHSQISIFGYRVFKFFL
jgi:hypothetical protein